MKKLILLLVVSVAFLAAGTLIPTEKYTIRGFVTDQKGEPLIGVNVILKDRTGGVSTDFDGRFSLEAKDSCVTLELTYIGYEKQEVEACAGKNNKFVMKENNDVLSEVVITSSGLKKSKKRDRRSKKNKREKTAAYDAPLIERDAAKPAPPATKVITSDDIKALPTRDVSALSGKVAGISSSEGSDITIRGSRAETTVHYIDGVKVADKSIPEGEVKLVELPMSGTPAKEATKKEIEKMVEYKDVISDDVEVLEEVIAIEDKPVEVIEKEVEVLAEDEEVMPEEKEDLAAGQLTAGEWNDLLNWEDWKSTVEEDLSPMESIWKINPGNRYSVMVKNKNGVPLPNAVVSLNTKNGNTLWQSKTNNTGQAELWQKKGGAKALLAGVPASITVEYDGVTEVINKFTSFEEGMNEIVIEADCPEYTKAEILFVVDATGSMGDEIRYLQAELGDVIKRVQNLDYIEELRTGSVFYRDHGDKYLTRTENLSSDNEATLKFIAKQEASGGGDGPEAVEDALEEAIMKQKWSDDAMARIAFVVLDAPPHNTEEVKTKMNNLTRAAAEKGIRIVPILASGSQSSCEYLMRAMALTTNSRFLFLTDDSGIGNAHAEPSVGAYNVVFLNDLIYRLIVEFTAYETCEELNQQTQNQQASAAIGSEDTFKASCYPLPANEYVFVDLENDVDKLEVHDMQGQLLLTKSTLPQGISTVFIDNLPPGTYLFKFIKEQQIQTVKVIKSGV